MTEKSDKPALQLPDINEIVKPKEEGAPAVPKMPAMVAGPMIPAGLKYDAEHHSRPGEDAVFSAPYIFSYDTRRMAVSDGEGGMRVDNLLIFKSVLINTLEDFVAAYASSVWMMVEISNQVKERKRQGVQIVNAQFAIQLVGAAERQLIATHERIANWDGKTPFQVVLPYSEIVTFDEDGPLNQKKGDIDTRRCKPRIVGMAFEARFSE